MRDELHLTALDNFRCLADQCPRTCCQGTWNLAVEDEVIGKWQSISDPVMRSEFLNYVSRDNEAGCTVLKKKTR